MKKYIDEKVFYENEILPHYAKIVKFIRKASGDSYIAEDIAQDTLLAAMEQIDKMKRYDNLEAALIKIASNNLKKYFKRIKNKFDFTPPEKLEELIDDKLEPMDNAAPEIVMKSFTEEELKTALEKLDEKSVKILILRYYYNLSLKEVARYCGMTYSAVRINHHRAIKKLKKHVTKERGYDST